jgi:hypothetical protein
VWVVTRRLHRAALAVALDGSVLANLAMLENLSNLGEVLAAVRDRGCEVFVGVRLDDAELVQVRERLDDAAAEVAAEIYGQRRRRETARRRRKTTS